MGKVTTQFRCSSCGTHTTKWVGKCPECGAFSTMEEEAVAPAPSKTVSIMGHESRGAKRTTARLTPTGLSTRKAPPPRTTTAHPELDRVLGGGLVAGSVILLGGAPGIGKSTLVLQVCANLSQGKTVVYISGEETEDQIQMRAKRLGVEQSSVDLISTNDCLAIADYIETLDPGSVVIVDSVQTLHSGGDSPPGSVSQVKAAAAHLIPAAKSRDVTLLLISHINKDGNLAGPMLLSHSVDAVLVLETDMSSGLYRIVRTEKNRFGPSDEVGLFEMTERGMIDIKNPSEVFIAQRDETAFGTIIFPSLEGSRPLLLEVQALVTPSAFGTGRRSATGWDSNRLNMLLATLSTRLGLAFADRDVYVNVAGGMRVTDPAMDLAVATAIVSSSAQIVLPSELAVFGEVGLSGEVRNSSRAEARIKEATNLGLSQIICPIMGETAQVPANASTSEIKRLSGIFNVLPELKAIYA